MTMAWSLLAAWLVAALLMALLWLIAHHRTNAGIVDVAWSFMTALLGAWFAITADGHPPRAYLVAGMAIVWGVRLGTHVGGRVGREPEDGRYQHLRGQWGGASARNLFVFFQIQALWAVMFAAPMLAAASNRAAPLGQLDWLGVAFWIVALTGESVADRQLARFKAAPSNRGRVCQVGLWRYSRHPNYFFEWLHWWAYVCLAAGSPYWWIAILGAAVMLVFLTKVTGIPPTEAQALRSRGDAYRRYQQTTSSFVPWPPAGPR